MCSYRVRCAAFITLMTLILPIFPPPVPATAIATAPEMVTSPSSVDSLERHVIAITAASPCPATISSSMARADTPP